MILQEAVKWQKHTLITAHVDIQYINVVYDIAARNPQLSEFQN